MQKRFQMVNLVQEFRVRNGLTQEQLAKKVGVSRNTISSIETGQYEPTAYTAALLCKVFNLKFEELFHFIEYK